MNTDNYLKYYHMVTGTGPILCTKICTRPRMEREFSDDICNALEWEAQNRYAAGYRPIPKTRRYEGFKHARGA